MTKRPPGDADRECRDEAGNELFRVEIFLAPDGCRLESSDVKIRIGTKSESLNLERKRRFRFKGETRSGGLCRVFGHLAANERRYMYNQTGRFKQLGSQAQPLVLGIPKGGAQGKDEVDDGV